MKTIRRILIVLFILLLVILLFYCFVPELLCSAIKYDSFLKEPLLWCYSFTPNRRTQPAFLDPITALLFEDAGKYPLIVACQFGDYETVEHLITVGADVNCVAGFTAMEAVYASPRKPERFRIARLLIKHGAEVDGHVGLQTALFEELVATSNDQESWKNIMLLIENGASKTDANGNTLLHAAILYSGTAYYIQNQLLLLQTVDINAQNYGGQTALMFAAKTGNRQSIDCLLNYGADRFIVNNEGKTAYDLALELGYIEIAELVKP